MTFPPEILHPRSCELCGREHTVGVLIGGGLGPRSGPVAAVARLAPAWAHWCPEHSPRLGAWDVDGARAWLRVGLDSNGCIELEVEPGRVLDSKTAADLAELLQVLSVRLPQTRQALELEASWSLAREVGSTRVYAPRPKRSPDGPRADVRIGTGLAAGRCYSCGHDVPAGVGWRLVPPAASVEWIREVGQTRPRVCIECLATAGRPPAPTTNAAPPSPGLRLVEP